MDNNTYILMLYVSLDQEYAISHLFLQNGWEFKKTAPLLPAYPRDFYPSTATKETAAPVYNNVGHQSCDAMTADTVTHTYQSQPAISQQLDNTCHQQPNYPALETLGYSLPSVNQDLLPGHLGRERYSRQSEYANPLSGVLPQQVRSATEQTLATVRHHYPSFNSHLGSTNGNQSVMDSRITAVSTGSGNTPESVGTRLTGSQGQPSHYSRQRSNLSSQRDGLSGQDSDLSFLSSVSLGEMDHTLYMQKRQESTGVQRSCDTKNTGSTASVSAVQNLDTDGLQNISSDFMQQTSNSSLNSSTSGSSLSTSSEMSGDLDTVGTNPHLDQLSQASVDQHVGPVSFQDSAGSFFNAHVSNQSTITSANNVTPPSMCNIPTETSLTQSSQKSDEHIASKSQGEIVRPAVSTGLQAIVSASVTMPTITTQAYPTNQSSLSDGVNQGQAVDSAASITIPNIGLGPGLNLSSLVPPQPEGVPIASLPQFVLEASGLQSRPGGEKENRDEPGGKLRPQTWTDEVQEYLKEPHRTQVIHSSDLNVQADTKFTITKDGTVCKDCKNLFTIHDMYLDHKRNKRCLIVCEYCGKSYPSRRRSTYELHLKVHKDQREFVCHVCGKSFVQSFQLRDHLLVHSGETPFPCTKCEAKFRTASALSNHMKCKHLDLPLDYACSLCGAAFKFQARLNSHIKSMHSGERNFQCDNCNKAFKTIHDLKRHQLRHEGRKDFVCEICNKGFTIIQGLNLHMKRHRNQRSHFCDTCGKGFYSSTHLKIHVRTHSGEKPFKCDFCPYQAAFKGNISKHVKVVHKLSNNTE